MEEKNCKLLFEYLRDILYDPKVKMLDVNELDEPYQKLGLGLNYLERAVKEMKAYSAALSKGDLSGFTPSRENFLCENLKNIHANLNHLTWQAKQVAKGDYSQTVSYLGEFSEAFNTMTKQLREREMILERKAEAHRHRQDLLEPDVHGADHGSLAEAEREDLQNDGSQRQGRGDPGQRVFPADIKTGLLFHGFPLFLGNL